MKHRSLATVLIALASLWSVFHHANIATGQANTSPIYHDMVLDESRQRIYATDRSGGALQVIDMSTLGVIQSLAIGSEPCGLDISPDGNELAVALYGQSEVAFLDLSTLQVITRVVPSIPFGPNKPYDVLYGRPGRLYSVGNPDSSGIDFVHAFDLATKVEVTRSTWIVRAAPRLALSPDKNTLYVGESSFSPQQIYRFDVSTDSIIKVGQGPHGPVNVNTLAVSADGSKVMTSRGQVWSSDLSTQIGSFSPSGSEIEYIASTNRFLISQASAPFSTDIAPKLFDIQNLKLLKTYPAATGSGVARASADGSRAFISTKAGIQVINVGGQFSHVSLPLVSRPHVGVFGAVTLNGAPASGEMLELRLFNGVSWETKAHAFADLHGFYIFSTLVALGPGQRMYVRYRNILPDAGRLAVWGTQLITQYSPGDSVALPTFDIADVALVAPSPGASVPLPATFSWVRRVATPLDSYAFEVFDAQDGDPYYTSGPLGYVGSTTLGGLPGSFQLGTPYDWGVIVYDDKGGLGLSLFSRQVTFASASAAGTAAFVPSSQSDRSLIVHGDAGR